MNHLKFSEVERGMVLVLKNLLSITTQVFSESMIMLCWNAVSFDRKIRTYGNVIFIHLLDPKAAEFR